MKVFILICIFVLFQFSKGSENNAEDPKEQNVLKKIWNRQHPKGLFVIPILIVKLEYSGICFLGSLLDRDKLIPLTD
jgi:hypothetical protein